MDSREITLWIDERWYNALSKHLKNETVEEKLKEYLDGLINQLPKMEYERISREINAEEERMRAQQEAQRKFAIFCVTQNGKTDRFETVRPFEFLNTANVLRSYLRGQSGQCFISTLGECKALTEEAFETYAHERMENTGRVAGAFKIDLDKGTVAALNIDDGWYTFSIKDVSTAAYHAMRKINLSWDKRYTIFLDRLDGKQLPAMNEEKPERFLRGERTLCAEDIQFAESIEQMENLLDFYMEVSFDADAVFGTYVCTDENDDYLNIYANYDMQAQCVCDTLEVVLVGIDRVEEYSYRLSDAEKTLLLSKMEEYVKQQWGESIADCVQRYRAENEREQAALDQMEMQEGML